MPESISLTKMIYYASLSEYMKWIPRKDIKWENLEGQPAIALIAYLFIITTKISIRIYVSVYHVEVLGEICLGNMKMNMCLQRYSPKLQKVGLYGQAAEVISGMQYGWVIYGENVYWVTVKWLCPSSVVFYS